MSRFLRTAAFASLVVVFLVTAHLALIEVGREVVTVRIRGADGRLLERRLWIVDQGEAAWLHSAGTEWAASFAGDPIVELERAGVVREYRAHAAAGPHPTVHRLLREKYGAADRWVRLIGPDDASTLAVRLEPLE
jgi:hypothetical protein